MVQLSNNTDSINGARQVCIKDSLLGVFAEGRFQERLALADNTNTGK